MAETRWNVTTERQSRKFIILAIPQLSEDQQQNSFNKNTMSCKPKASPSNHLDLKSRLVYKAKLKRRKG